MPRMNQVITKEFCSEKEDISIPLVCLPRCTYFVKAYHFNNQGTFCPDSNTDHWGVYVVINQKGNYLKRPERIPIENIHVCNIASGTMHCISADTQVVPVSINLKVMKKK